MNPATLTLPSKSVVLADGSTVVINSGTLLSVRAASATTCKGTIWFGNATKSFTSATTAAAFVVGWPSISVTDSTGAVYIPTGAIREMFASGTGTTIGMSVNPGGADYSLLNVTESLATVQAAYDAVVASGSGGGVSTTASYTATGTNQGTAAATTTTGIRITGGAAATGIILPAATVGMERNIYNATTTSKFVYPATSGFMDPNAVNEPIELGPGEGIALNSTLALHWNSDENENSQSVAATGLVQLGGQIRAGVQDATVISATGGVNTAVTLPSALPGKRITVANITSVNVRLYPFTGDQIEANGANTFVTLSAGKTVELICEVAGTWKHAVSEVETLAVATIQPLTTTANVNVTDPVTGRIAQFASTGIILDIGVSLSNGSGTATPGGVQADGLPISANIFDIAICATLGDSCILTAVANPCWIRNNGAAASYVYCPVSSTMDGTLNGFAIVYPGETVVFRQGDTATVWTTNRDSAERAQSLTATPAGTQGTSIKANGKYVVLATVATALDGVTIDPLDGVKEFIVFNNAGVSASLFPPVGGTIDGGAANAAFVVPRSCAFKLATTNGLDYKVWLLPGATQVATADAGSTQATGTPIVSPFVNCTVVATTGDAYTIKTYSPRSFTLWNRDATESLDLFPPVGGTIDGGAVDAAFAIPAGVGFKVSSIDGQAWLVELLNGSVQSSTASASSDQAGGTQVVSPYVSVATVATAGDSYTIRAWSPRSFEIWNRDSTESLDLFPPVGGTVNGGAANAAFAIAAGHGFRVLSNDGITFVVELLPNSLQGSTANVGSSQATGTPVVGSVECLVSANAGDAYTIQSYSPWFFHIRNSGANSLDLFPPVGGQINGGGANVALAVAAAAAYIVYSNNGTLWYAVLQ